MPRVGDSGVASEPLQLEVVPTDMAEKPIGGEKLVRT